MERCAELIEKLTADFNNDATPEQLLHTIQILQKELSMKVTNPSYKKSAKVSVVMPNLFQTNIFGTPQIDYSNVITENITPEIKEEEKTIEPIAINEPNNILITEETEELEEELPAIIYHELPTVVHNENLKLEVNDIVANANKDINEKLVETKVELADVLTEAPIKDLKKGIALNDKFVFVSELFRGDESMYERSIKTINSFQIFPEAQYWIERELKTKIGWDTENETVQHFYNIVKRRFAVI